MSKDMAERISELEQHVSELEKSLENARNERDEATAALGVAVSAGKVGQSHTRELIEACKRWEQAATEALKQRDAALADNAAKEEALAAYVEFHGVEHEEDDCPEDDTCACPHVVALNKAFGPSHPGAALLEVVSELRRYQYRDEPDVLATLRRLLTERSRIAHMINPEQHRKALEPLQAVVDGLASEMERTIHHREQKGGMSVPDHGDFCSAPPSMLARMRWWARELREALAGHTSALMVRARNEGLEEAVLLFVTLEQDSEDEGDTEAALDARHWIMRIRALKEPEEGGQS